MGTRRSTHVEIIVTGDREFGRELLGMSRRALNMTPAFVDIVEHLRDWVRAQYSSRGARSGDRWQALAASTVRAKALRGLDPRIMLATHDLYNSLAHRSADSLVDIDADSLTFGSKLDYFKYHQSRKPRTKLPRRPVIALTELDKREVVKILQRHIVSLRRAVSW